MENSANEEEEEEPVADDSVVDSENDDPEPKEEDTEPPVVSSPPPIPTPPHRTGRRGRPPGSKNKSSSLLARDGSLPARSLRHLTPKSRDRSNDADDANDDSVSVSAAAPSRRGGRRGGRWATRGNRKAGSTHATTSLGDSNDPSHVIENDEIVFPTNPKGETKINENGELLGGRQFRVRTFTVLGRGSRHYMLSTEPARCMGFRDSYLLFQKHKRLYKVIISDDEKFDLIDRELIPHSYKGRAIGIVTAKSVFREFGAKIVVGGRRVIDDYDEEEAKAMGYREGEVADPADRLPPPGVPYNKNQYVAWHGASAVYHQYTNNPPARSDHSGHGIGVGFGSGLSLSSLGMGHGNKESYAKRNKIVITDENWMFEHASAAREFNHAIYERRKRAFETLGPTPEESVANCEAAGLLLCSSNSTPGGIYEPHTGLFFYPESTQPKRVRYIQVSERLDDRELKRLDISTGDESQVPGLKKEVGEDEPVVRAGRRKNATEEQLEKVDQVSSSTPKGNMFVAHPEIVIDTQVDLRHPLVPLTGLLSVPKHVFEDAPPEIQKAILEQQNIERLATGC